MKTHLPENRNPLAFLGFLRDKRIEKGITQKKLASKLKISHMYLSHFENETRIPTIPLLEKWANILGFEISIGVYSKPKK